MTYYAIEHTYGATTKGGEILHTFTSKAARDSWVSQGPAYFTAPGARTAEKASSRLVRALKGTDAVYTGQRTQHG